MNRVVFSTLADSDIDELWLNIALDNEPAANRVVDELHETLQKLLLFPGMGRVADHLRLGARMFVHRDYLIVYRVMDYGVAVLRIAHGARNLELLPFPPAPLE